MAEKPLTLREVLTFAARDKAPLCSVKHCRNLRVPNRSICHRHKQAAWRLRNPIRSAWCALRDHAKGRGIGFGLLFDVFREICERTGYHVHKGNSRLSLTIDRIDPRGDYELPNVRVITLVENSSKGSYERRFLLRGQAVPFEFVGVPSAEEFETERRKQYVAHFNTPAPAPEPADADEEQDPEWLR